MSLTKVTYSMIDGAIVNVRDYGAAGDGVTNDSSAIQSAIDTGKSIEFPQGTYLAGNLTQSTAGQRFYGRGNVVVKKNANGVLLTASGRGVMFEGIKFDGNVAFTGDCVKTTGDNCVFTNCSVWTAKGFALLAEGNGTRIIGTSDIYYSDDASGFAICLGNTSADTNYHQIVGITTSTSPNGILCRRTGASSLVASQVGDIDCSSGALFISNCRIVGNYVAQAGFNTIDNSTISGDVTIGDGTTVVSGMGFGANVFMQSGTTFTLNANVRESTIHTAQLANTTVVDNLTGTANDIDNFIFSKPANYTPTWTASGTAPSLGNGSISGYYIRNGRMIQAYVSMQLGSTSTTGSGDWRFSLPSTAQRDSIGSSLFADAGTQSYIGASFAVASQSYATIGSNNAGGNLSASIPFTWTDGDFLRFSVQYETV